MATQITPTKNFEQRVLLPRRSDGDVVDFDRLVWLQDNRYQFVDDGFPRLEDFARGRWRAPDEREIKRAQEWLEAYASPTDRWNVRMTSSMWKGLVEDWLKTDRDLAEGVSNGAFCTAAMRAGYQCLRIEGELDAVFNMETSYLPATARRDD